MKRLLLLTTSVILFHCTNKTNDLLSIEDSASIKTASLQLSPEDQLDSNHSNEDEEQVEYDYNDYKNNTLVELKLNSKAIDTSVAPPNPRTMVAIYEEAAIGDYFHLTFKDEAGKGWDFGDGKNNYNNYELTDENGETNTNYKGKQFIITWDSVRSVYTCCNGEMHAVEGRVPTILDMKLKEE